MAAGIPCFLYFLSLIPNVFKGLLFKNACRHSLFFCTVHIPLQMSSQAYILKDICRQSLLATIIVQAAWRLIFERGTHEKLHICFMLKFATS